MIELTIYDILNEPLKLIPPIRMFEAFSGIGTQAMALKRLNVPYEIVGFSEIDKYAIASYHAIHGDIKNYGDITKMTEIPSCDIFTWSFPCTDLSNAGRQAGMTKDTRSGLVFDVLRLVRDTKEKPKVLIMENVVALIQKKFIEQFKDIKKELETYGYTNYVETLNSKDFGVAQYRNRVFMVSILGDETYNFPKGYTLNKRLKDYLENQVDDHYYLSEKMMKYITENNLHWTGNNGKSLINKTIASTINTAEGNRRADASNFISNELPDNFDLKALRKFGIYGKSQGGSVFDISQLSPTLTTKSSMNWNVLIDEATKINDILKIRKLTPKETWRLMGITDEDFYKAQQHNSNTQLYKQSGNAIVVDVFQAILKEMIYNG